MFRKFDKSHKSKQSLMRASDLRNMKKYLDTNYAINNDQLEYLFPRKSSATVIRMTNKHSVIFNATGDVVLCTPEQVYVPTLRTIHRYPHIIGKIYVHEGAAKNLLRGANVMLVGIKLEVIEPDQEWPQNTPVAIYIEGKHHAISVGITDIFINRNTVPGKGKAITILHHLGDELWYNANTT